MGRGQGDHVGTGQPISFMCHRLRRDVFYTDRTAAVRAQHRVKRTGREKGPRHETYNRTLSYKVEYRCSCGHVGWTNHRDVLRQPRGCPDGGTCHHECEERGESWCWRVAAAEPLSGVFANDYWPREYKATLPS